MKGIFFSADFVRDNSGNFRYLELNTDTSIATEYIEAHNDWAPFIEHLKTNNITLLELVYKPVLHLNLIENLEKYLEEHLPDIEINHNTELTNSTVPVVPEESEGCFVLRFCYDETAVVDSTYTKNNVNTLNLLAESGNVERVVPYYYSDGSAVYDHLTSSINANNIPDLVVKSVEYDRSNVEFWKLGNSLPEADRVRNFVENSHGVRDNKEKLYITNYLPGNLAAASSLRVYGVLYNDTLDFDTIGMHIQTAQFTYPDINDIQVPEESAKLFPFHHYEFSTSVIKDEFDPRPGIFETEKIILEDGTSKAVDTINEGDVVTSLHIEGLPDTDNPAEYFLWKHKGNALPSGSHLTTSTVTYNPIAKPGVNSIYEIVIEGEDPKYLSDSSALLVYDKAKDVIRFTNVKRIDPDKFLFINKDGQPTTIVSNKHLLYRRPVGSFYVVDVDPTDTIILEGNLGLVLHNVFFCFPAGTEVLLANEDMKYIQDIVVGDEVLCYNEETKEVEQKKVINTKAPIHDDLVRITLTNGKEIVSTFDHPYYTSEYELKSYRPKLTSTRYQLDRGIGQLSAGDFLIDASLQPVEIEKIVELDREDTQTYIFEVEGNHNFFANGLLVHNKGTKCFMPGAMIRMADDTLKPIEEIVVGDIVSTMNGGSTSVEDVYEYNVQAITNMYSNGNVTVTDTHPMFLDGEWKTADVAGWKSEAIYVDKLYNLNTNSNFIIEGIPADGTTHNGLNVVKDEITGYATIYNDTPEYALA